MARFLKRLSILHHFDHECIVRRVGESQLGRTRLSLFAYSGCLGEGCETRGVAEKCLGRQPPLRASHRHDKPLPCDCSKPPCPTPSDTPASFRLLPPRATRPSPYSSRPHALSFVHS